MQGIGPDPTHEAPVEAFLASGCAIDPGLMPVAEASFDDPPHTDESVEVQEYDGVGSTKPHIDGRSMVAVDDPCWALNQFLLERFPLLPWRLDPSGTPEDRIEVNDRYAELGAQLARKCRFACTT